MKKTEIPEAMAATLIKKGDDMKEIVGIYSENLISVVFKR